MVAYLQRKDIDTAPDDTRPARIRSGQRHALARDMFHGLSPDEFHNEAQSVADAEAVTPQVRARLRTQLVERLKTPIDAPSWGPDWIKDGDESSTEKKKEGGFRLSSLFPSLRKNDDDAGDEKDAVEALDEDDQ